MKQFTLFVVLAISTTLAHAGYYKCQSAEGVTTYSEYRCNTGRQFASASNNRNAADTASANSRIKDINAVPLPAPALQRKSYEDFLNANKPKAFMICRNGSVRTVVGEQEDSFQNLIKKAKDEGCATYAINGDVVWEGL